MNKAELPKPRLLKPVEDFSTFLPNGYASFLLDQARDDGTLIYNDDNLIITKQNITTDGIPALGYTAYDTTNGLPHFGLDLIEGKNDYRVTTWDYVPVYLRKDYPIDKDDIKIVSLYTHTIPNRQYEFIWESILDVNSRQLRFGHSQTSFFDQESYAAIPTKKKLKNAEAIAKQISLIPGEEVTLPKSTITRAGP